MKMTKNISKQDKKMLNSIFLRSFTVFAGRSGGQTRQHAVGFIYSLLPALNRYYPSEAEHSEALVRHTTFYNITQNVGTFAMGLVASMEKENSENKDFDPQSIVAIKTALMGPMSGIGDSIFWGVLRVIAAGVGINLALQGSILGPIMFLLIYNIPSIACRYYLTFAGFSVGSGFLESMHTSGSMKTLTKAASTVGLIMIGGMTASMVKFSTILKIGVAGSTPISVQTYIDTIFVGIIPLLLTLSVLYLLNKKVNVNIVMLGVMVLAILLAILGVV